ncbi:MAG: pyridoxine 5'-phosphate synthase [Tepidisphaeraceae bacterium]
MTSFSLNINKIATLRNTRHVGYPDLLKLSRVALDSGAAGITVHPRPDERHIRAADVQPIADLCKHAGVEFNIEGNPFEGKYLKHCRTTVPTQCTLVPDAPGQNTSDHGWDFLSDVGRTATLTRVTGIVGELKRIGCRVSLFIDANPQQIERAADTGADRVELYTEPYASAFATGDYLATLDRFVKAANRATALGLKLNAGHDLTLDNLPVLLAAIPQIEEVSIGHAVISDALEFGLAETVRKYVAICRRA